MLQILIKSSILSIQTEYFTSPSALQEGFVRAIRPIYLIGTSGEFYLATGFVTMFSDVRKPTIELNLGPSRNQDQFDFAILPLLLQVCELQR